MKLSEVESFTRNEFTAWRNSKLNIYPILIGASDRFFFRVCNEDLKLSLICMIYDDSKIENLKFKDLTIFLNKINIQVPNIYKSIRDNSYEILWLEDLGDTSLKSLNNSDWEKIKRPAYISAIFNISKLHNISEKSYLDLNLEPPFSRELYLWEQTYFLDFFVSQFISKKDSDFLKNNSELTNIIEEIIKFDRFLIHRDFQSTNILILKQNAHFIDYQGARWGLPEYDIASLVYDPYVDLTESQQNDLISCYLKLNPNTTNREKELFYKKLNYCAIQRLMQSVGAYAYLNKVKDNKRFMKYIPKALNQLKIICENMNLKSINKIISKY